MLDARPLEWDGWRPVAAHSLPGFRRLMTSVGMVNVVDTPWGLGGYAEVVADADRLQVVDGLAVAVVSLESVIRSKKAMVGMAERPRHSRTMDSLHVLMGEESLALKKKTVLGGTSRLYRRNPRCRPPKRGNSTTVAVV